MVRIILIAVIVLGLAAGYFGIEAKSKITSTRAELEGVKSSASSSLAKIKEAEEAQKAAEQKAAELTTAKSTLESEIATAKSEVTKAQSAAAAADSKVKEKEDEITAVRNQLAEEKEARAKLENAPVDNTHEEKIREIQVKLDEQLQIAQTLEASKKAVEEKAAGLEAELARIRSNQSKPGLEGKILGVNPNWNFVLLSVGDRQGVAVNSTLLVKRGADLIAKLRVTSIDRTTSVADVVPGSVAKGASVQPGDTVIFGG